MGSLFVVATPIGNLQDITLRAARALLESRIIIAESTSKCGILLEFLRKTFPEIRGSTPKIISFTEDEEENKIPKIIRLLEENDATLISEAGTPLISDPGFKLVREAIRKGVRIIPIPGASSVTASLTVSGFPTNKFTFTGFLPKSGAKRKRELTKLKESDSTIVLFESPHRLIQTLKDIHGIFGNIDVVIARELTKIHEETMRGKVTDLVLKFEEKPPKGELVILFYC